MRTDRELLELAARAAGYEPQGMEQGLMYLLGVQDGWNPLDDDGDALRLAVQLGMNVDIGQRFTEASMIVCDIRIGADEAFGNDKFAATRRAIVRAAAEIGAASPPALNQEGEQPTKNKGESA